MELDLTKLSQKGQVVIPSNIRRELKLREGMRFLVLGIGDTIVLRRLKLTEERLRLKRVLEASRKKAARVGFSDMEIERLIRQTRKVP